jgi:hypothetical protein
MKMMDPISGFVESIPKDAQNFIHPYVNLSEPFDFSQDKLRERRIPVMKVINSLRHRDSSRLAALRMTTYHPQRLFVESELMYF